MNSNVTKEGFPVLLLRILESNDIEPVVRQAGAIFFKNLVKTYWGNVNLYFSFTNPLKREAGICPSDRVQIKQSIVNLMLSTTPQIQKLLSASLEIICEHDFPREWESLLPVL